MKRSNFATMYLRYVHTVQTCIHTHLPLVKVGLAQARPNNYVGCIHVAVHTAEIDQCKNSTFQVFKPENCTAPRRSA